MLYLTDVDRLERDGVLSPEQGAAIRQGARGALLRAAVGVILGFGILAATAGLIVWLAAPLPVAGAGLLFAALGALALRRTGEDGRFLGGAVLLVGLGLLLGGLATELVSRAPGLAGPATAALGAALAAGAALAMRRGAGGLAAGAALLAGIGLHLFGMGFWAAWADWPTLAVSVLSLHAAALLMLGGAATDLRALTALAIVPFAQVLSTGTAYWHATYAFFSPEPTLSILQMAALIGAALWAMGRLPERWARHAGVLAVMAAVVAGLCALVGSLFGDWVGETIWAHGAMSGTSDWFAEREAFRAEAIHVSRGAYTAAFALFLAVAIAWAAERHRRGLFNTAVAFAAIHAYTQAFESFGDEPLAYVIGGLLAIPFAWGVWRIDRRWRAAA